MVLWVNKDGDAITHNMSYDNGRLSVKKEGYYYLYSKLLLNAADECSLIQHKVMKDTKAYDKSIELMKSKRLVSAPLLPSFLCCCNLFGASLVCIYMQVEICTVFLMEW